MCHVQYTQKGKEKNIKVSETTHINHQWYDAYPGAISACVIQAMEKIAISSGTSVIISQGIEVL